MPNLMFIITNTLLVDDVGVIDVVKPGTLTQPAAPVDTTEVNGKLTTCKTVPAGIVTFGIFLDPEILDPDNEVIQVGSE